MEAINKLLILVCLFFVGCVTVKDGLAGSYYSKGKDYSYSLELNADSTFRFTQRYTEVKSSCDGNWKAIDDNTILLECFPAEFPEQLQGGYMSERERKVEVINPRKLKIGSVFLKLTE